MKSEYIDHIAGHRPEHVYMNTAEQQDAFNKGVIYGRWLLANRLLENAEAEQMAKDKVDYNDGDYFAWV